MAITGKFQADFNEFYTATQKADRDLRALEAGADHVGTSFNRMTSSGSSGLTTFHQGLSQADKTLAAFGVHIGPEIHAIKELGEASGKTASQIGLIGTAGLAAAAALAGWKVGRLVADFFDLDEAIGKATAKLLGWGDLAAQEAAAGTDVLARASKIAGHEITTMAEAMRIIAAEIKANLAPSYEKFSASVADSHREYRHLDDTQRANIRTMLESDASMKKITETLKISEGAVTALTKADKLRADQQKVNTKLAQEQTKAQEKAEKDYREFQNFVGIRQMEDEAARMKQTADAAQAEADAKKKAEEEWFQSVNEGLVLIGMQTKAVGEATAATTQQMADGWKLVGTEAKMAATNIQLAVPQGFSYEEAYRKAGLFVHESYLGGLRPGKEWTMPTQGTMPGVTVNYYDAQVDTPAGQQRTAQRTAQAILSQARSQGRSIG